MNWKYRFVAGAAVIVTAVLLVWGWPHAKIKGHLTDGFGQSLAVPSTKSHSDISSWVDGENPPLMPNATGATWKATTSVRDSVVDMLSKEGSGAWREIERKYFNTLDPVQLWQLLSASGVADQFEAKEIRSRIAGNCSVILSLNKAGKPLPKSLLESSQTAFCVKLGQEIGAEEIFDQARNLANDPEYQDHFGNGVTSKGMNDSQRNEIITSLASILADTTDPYQASDTVNSLWDKRSSLITDDWSAIDGPITLGLGIAPEMRYNLKVAVSISTACLLIGGCGPSNPWTLEYCSTGRNTCTPNMGLQDAISYNLSPRVLMLYWKIMANMQTYMRSSGR